VNNLNFAIKSTLIFLAAFLLTSCTFRPILTEATVRGLNEMEIVEVVLRSADAQKIRDREIYFSIVLVDCEDVKKRFPMQPYIAGQLATDFSFQVSSSFVTIEGSVPESVFTNFPAPCVKLQGGSYVFGKLESTSINLVRKE